MSKEVVNNINTLTDSTPLCPTDVYSVTGVRVGNTDDINALPAGIYYTCGKKILVKQKNKHTPTLWTRNNGSSSVAD